MGLALVMLCNLLTSPSTLGSTDGLQLMVSRIDLADAPFLLFIGPLFLWLALQLYLGLMWPQVLIWLLRFPIRFSFLSIISTFWSFLDRWQQPRYVRVRLVLCPGHALLQYLELVLYCWSTLQSLDFSPLVFLTFVICSQLLHLCVLLLDDALQLLDDLSLLLILDFQLLYVGSKVALSVEHRVL